VTEFAGLVGNAFAFRHELREQFVIRDSIGRRYSTRRRIGE
jgi:hypothetical protein